MAQNYGFYILYGTHADQENNEQKFSFYSLSAFQRNFSVLQKNYGDKQSLVNFFHFFCFRSLSLVRN